MLHYPISHKPVSQLIAPPSTTSSASPISTTTRLYQAQRAALTPRTYLQVHLHYPAQSYRQRRAHEVLERQRQSVHVHAETGGPVLLLTRRTHQVIQVEAAQLLERLVHQLSGVSSAGQAQIGIRQLTHVLNSLGSHRDYLLLDDERTQPEADVNECVEYEMGRLDRQAVGGGTGEALLEGVETIEVDKVRDVPEEFNGQVVVAAVVSGGCAAGRCVAEELEQGDGVGGEA